ncbi:hypothetical protein LPTSP3_g22680 [Leptospira kobayashii]|uniref:Flavodoxin-like fold domain-containing protein n=1 Tax=Leptospira kobayashii TaxID=1917830 RepID=A0ABN6KHP1_9LEPT|nr:NAD(P)H-dependent oxidoreductase [Leptospira kobayashii]BDA79338.1 hypothetical protein LPTSP3_g22680 [Leptospira kobayashii]
MAKVLLLFVHPSLEKSKVNRTLIDFIPTHDDLTFHDLYEEYPNFHINIKKEQDLLTDHDILLIQHPLYWYSVPALFKQWIDSVLEKGWAYGEGGDKLKGKVWKHIISTGGGEDAYQLGGFHNHPIENFLLPFQRTAELCQMNFEFPFLIQGSFRLSEAATYEAGLRYKNLLSGLLEK